MNFYRVEIKIWDLRFENSFKLLGFFFFIYEFKNVCFIKILSAEQRKIVVCEFLEEDAGSLVV